MLLLLAAALAPSPAPFQDTYDDTRRLMPSFAMTFGVSAVGDLDGDGALDVLFVTPGDDHLLYGSAATAFHDGSTDLPSFGPANNAIALGDVDGDGALDAVVGSLGAPTGVFRNVGGVLTPHATLGIAPMVGDVDLADLDRDGDLDLVVASTSTTLPNEVWRNDGAGNLTLDPSALAAIAHEPTSAIAITDVDGDALPDLYLARTVGFDVLLLGTSGGTFVEAPASPLGLESTEAQVGDSDGDGLPEIAVVTEGGDVFVVRGLGSGITTYSKLPSDAPEAAGSRLTFADVDADGRDDVVTTGPFPQVFLALVAGGFSEETHALPASLFGPAAVADFDDDQDLDLMFQGSQPALMLRGKFEYHDVHPHFGGPLTPGPDAAAGDVDGDGDDDLVGSAKVYLSDGAGGLAEGGPVPFAGASIELVDLDGDADLDALLAIGQSLHYAANDGAGAFADAGLVGGLLGIRVATAGDLDGDGDADVVAARWYTTALLTGVPLGEVRLNDGTGAFPSGSALSATVEIEDPTLVDLDLDGDLDLLYGGLPSEAHENDGTGSFALTSAFVPPGLDCAFLATGDVDADGDPDAVFSRLSGDLLFLNDGTGALLPAAPGMLPAPSGDTGRPTLADADGNGDLDLFSLGKTHRFYAGGGTGAFATPEVLATRANASAVVLDLDLDGDLDVVGGGDDPYGAWLHVAGGQTARRTPPRIGKPLVVQTYGEPGAAYLLAVAPFAASIPLGAYGTLALDPATVKVVASGAIPSDGRAADQIAVPNVQPLVGATIHWQSLVGTPGTFTTAEPMTLTAD